MTTRTQGMMLGQLCMSTVYVSFMVELTTVYLSSMVGHGSRASINSIRRASLDDSARQTAHPIGLCLGEGQQVIARRLQRFRCSSGLGSHHGDSDAAA